MQEIKGESQLAAFLEGNKYKITIVDFRAPWCGPCRVMEPILAEIEKIPGVSVVKVNTSEALNSQLTQKYGITSLPTIRIQKWHEVLYTGIGALPEKVIIAQLAKHGVIPKPWTV